MFTPSSLWHVNVQSGTPFKKMGRQKQDVHASPRDPRSCDAGLPSGVCLPHAHGAQPRSFHRELLGCASGRGAFLALITARASGDPSPGGSRPNRTADVGPGRARPERTVHPQSRGAHPQGQRRARLPLPGRTSASPTGASPDQDLSYLASPPPRQHNGEQEVMAWVPSRPMLGDDSETPRLLAPRGA